MKKTDIIIIGQGPAGLSAAIYTARAGLKTMVLGCDPKVAGDYVIDNYFGFPESVTGKELIQLGCQHAQKFGAELRCEKVLGIHQDQAKGFVVKTDRSEVQARAIILATGVSRVRPGIGNISEFEGKGVSYCVSCDGFFYKKKKVIVLGEGVFAANQALELKNYTARISICTQGKKDNISKEYHDLLEKNQIPVLTEKITTLKGGAFLEKAIFSDGREEDVDGLFLAMGEASSLDFAYSLGVTTRGVFIEADHDQRTNVPGVFAAGDCVGRFLQISVAVGEGAIAGHSAITYLKKTNN
ncbi:NAD(P)/FAD-dependent oxidoreductase [Desulfonatronovibrio hydrogenovorans]|uniref:NAD(P)/FAD-dependent oxidoreductase n=1 Tax=Desulfonatronovibrio hydrogenovorans TaxID=53245 RepID=UPI00048CFBDC|nr:NAD(P)/FAD-dependent oxidoreductase [Desulfonatronovibrio hydrogenovorans]